MLLNHRGRGGRRGIDLTALAAALGLRRALRGLQIRGALLPDRAETAAVLILMAGDSTHMP